MNNPQPNSMRRRFASAIIFAVAIMITIPSTAVAQQQRINSNTSSFQIEKVDKLFSDFREELRQLIYALEDKLNSTSSSQIANSSNPVDPLIWLAASWGIAMGGGIVAGLLEYFADSEKKLDKGKLKKPIILGLISGLLFGIANGSINPAFKDPKSSPVDIAYQLGLVFVGVLGIDAVTYHKAKVSERKMALKNCARRVRESKEKAESKGTIFGMERLTIAAERNERFADNSQTETLTTSQFYRRVHEWIKGEIKSLEDEREKLKEIRMRP
ncbi:MAG: hypothetical protein WAM14_16840 [Candidatus Nitrosopolaris sp.]